MDAAAKYRAKMDLHRARRTGRPPRPQFMPTPPPAASSSPALGSLMAEVLQGPPEIARLLQHKVGAAAFDTFLRTLAPGLQRQVRAKLAGKTDPLPPPPAPPGLQPVDLSKPLPIPPELLCEGQDQ